MAVIMKILRRRGASVPASVFPVSAHASGRYLIDAQSNPRPILGRVAWFLTSLNQAAYQDFIDDTADKGFNAIEFHVVNHDPRGNTPPYAGNGELPFTKRLDGNNWSGALTYGTIGNEAPDFTQTNEAYWTHVDGIVSYALSRNIKLLIFPNYYGYSGSDQGWASEIVANGTTKMQTYGAFVADRYKNAANIIWMLGGDRGVDPAFSTNETNVQQAILDGFASVAGQQSTQTSCEWGGQSVCADEPTFGADCSLNGVHDGSGDFISITARGAYSDNAGPAFLQEGPFDQEGSDGNSVNLNATQPVRRFHWWAWLSTIGGYVAGNGYVWPFKSGYSDHLTTTDATCCSHLNAFIKSVAWHRLVPSGLGSIGTLLTAGAGTVGTDNYAAAAATPEGDLFVVYIAPGNGGPVTADMTKLSGTVTARWLDPVSGAYTAIGTYANTGTRQFTTPGNNSGGDADWVLRLDA